MFITGRHSGFLAIFVIMLTMTQNLGAARDPFLFSEDLSSSRPASDLLPSSVIPLHYAKATELAQWLMKTKGPGGLISPRGHVEADTRTNQLWIEEDALHLQYIRHLVQQWDVPVLQVFIKARIVSVDDHFTHTLGLLFSTARKSSESSSSDADLSTSTVEAGTIEFPIARLGNGRQLDLALSALEQAGHANVLSKPELMAHNHQMAVIESGEEVPYQEKTGQGNTSVTFKKATLRLKITPDILPGGRILLHLTVNQDKISHWQVNGVPVIRTQQLTTQVLLRNQETVVLGGIYEHIHSFQEEGVPVLRHLPLMGALFRHRSQINQRKQLLIFVTPEVIHE
ncbi:MAG: hypothetical protein A3F17_08140 [Gammaproteobacteria bacterium RIFCSPHIGHO2_12_FULL_41_15]|nr:MAG: hypothetical protein A3F17_08140 [Gammaproteobacteria bacterium RIFCSPHIGHO2_12_FULL_41_15]